MFSFARKDAVNKAADRSVVNQRLPEGCEALLECEFTEISGAGASVGSGGTFTSPPPLGVHL